MMHEMHTFLAKFGPRNITHPRLLKKLVQKYSLIQSSLDPFHLSFD